MNPELAGEHESGDCTIDCTHPDCIWVGAVDQVVLAASLFDDVEAAVRDPLMLWVPVSA